MKVSKRLRREILAARGLVCHWCGFSSGREQDFDIDHLKPRSLGGTAHKRNLVVACASCNRSRGARPVSQACAWIARSVHVRQSPQERFEAAFDGMRVAMAILR